MCVQLIYERKHLEHCGRSFPEKKILYLKVYTIYLFRNECSTAGNISFNNFEITKIDTQKVCHFNMCSNDLQKKKDPKLKVERHIKPFYNGSLLFLF